MEGISKERTHLVKQGNTSSLKLEAMRLTGSSPVVGKEGMQLKWKSDYLSCNEVRVQISSYPGPWSQALEDTYPLATEFNDLVEVYPRSGVSRGGIVDAKNKRESSTNVLSQMERLLVFRVGFVNAQYYAKAQQGKLCTIASNYQ